MNKWLWLIGLILIVPLIGFAAAKGVQAHLNSELRSALQGNFPDATQAEIAKVSLDRLCEESPTAFREICGTNTNLNLLGATSVGREFEGVMSIFLIFAPSGDIYSTKGAVKDLSNSPFCPQIDIVILKTLTLHYSRPLAFIRG